VKLIDEKLTDLTKPEQEKLADLLRYVEFEYDGEEAARDDETFNKITKNLEELEKFIKEDADSPENKLFKGLGDSGQEIVRKLRNQMAKKRDAMVKIRKTEPGDTPKLSPLVIFSIIAAGLVLL